VTAADLARQQYRKRESQLATGCQLKSARGTTRLLRLGQVAPLAAVGDERLDRVVELGELVERSPIWRQKRHVCRICQSRVVGNRHEPLRGARSERQVALDHGEKLAVPEVRPRITPPRMAQAGAAGAFFLEGRGRVPRGSEISVALACGRGLRQSEAVAAGARLQGLLPAIVEAYGAGELLREMEKRGERHKSRARRVVVLKMIVAGGDHQSPSSPTSA
jgi:hypothetical protein